MFYCLFHFPVENFFLRGKFRSLCERIASYDRAAPPSVSIFFLFFSLELLQKSTHYLRFPAVDLWSEDTCTTPTSSWSFFWSRLGTWPSTLRVRGGRGKCYKHCPNRDSHRLPLGQESSVFKGRPKLAWRRRKCVNISIVCLLVFWAESTTENYARVSPG